MWFAPGSYLFLCLDMGGSGPDCVSLHHSHSAASSVLVQRWNGAHRPPTPSHQACCCLSHPGDCPAPSLVSCPPFLAPTIVFSVFYRGHSGIPPCLYPFLFFNTGEGNGNPLQYSCLENPMDRGAWWVTVHGVANSRTRLSDFTFLFNFFLIPFF